jgi:hypothetical protein
MSVTYNPRLVQPRIFTQNWVKKPIYQCIRGNRSIITDKTAYEISHRMKFRKIRFIRKEIL